MVLDSLLVFSGGFRSFLVLVSTLLMSFSPIWITMALCLVLILVSSALRVLIVMFLFPFLRFRSVVLLPKFSQIVNFRYVYSALVATYKTCLRIISSSDTRNLELLLQYLSLTHFCALKSYIIVRSLLLSFTKTSSRI